MKTSNKSSIVTGIVLLALAAFFSICLLLQPLDFGVGGPGHNNFFFLIGDILSSVYGFSSILIPVFLLISGLSCFATTWTARKTLRLLTAIIPFFTCVITENICRSITEVSSSYSVIKMIITLVTGAALVVIEYLGIGILADKINNHTPKAKDADIIDVDDIAEDADEIGVYDIKEPAASANESPVEEIEFTPIKTKTSKTSDTLTKIKEKFKQKRGKKAKSDHDLMLDTDIYENVVEEETAVDVNPPVDEDLNSSVFDDIDFDSDDKADETDKAEIPAEDDIFETATLDANKTESKSEPESESKDEERNPSSMISQEEFAALTTPIYDETFDVEHKEEDELEWNNLPPKQETLPPDYDGDLDFDDPDLEFPPKEAVESEPEVPVETPAAKKYSDAIVENPAFSHGISIHDADETPAESEETPKPVAKKSNFPTRIQLTEDATFDSTPEPEDDGDYVEDETLPFPEFDVDEPAINAVTPSEVEENTSFNEDDISPFDESFFDDNMTAEEASEKVGGNIFNQIASSKVFSEMDEDIRREQQKDEADQPETEISFDGVHKVQKQVGPDLDNPAGGVNNLTADELSDFFNAQQDENTPKTKQIQANPPKIGNRAAKKGPYVIPSDLLTAYKDDQYWIIDDATKQASLNLKQTLSEFNIEADITGIKKGPVVTMFEILPAPGVKLSKIVALQDNIALSLAAQSVRIVAPIPGKQAVGIEVPNKHRSVVGFREIIEMDLPEWNKMAVPVVLGKDILGKAQLIDLAKTPHMLIAGATGSGKSVCVNSLILSILYKRSPQDVKMILVDPKVVELKLYNNIPHLLTPVITEPKKALQALQWCLCEMERRYALLDGMGVRDISNYNTKIKAQNICTEKLPYIVLIIDEFADLMATSGKELETIVARLTAMSRAVGIHLVLATQRPSVNVITGLIKANIPTRIAFMVASRTDSNIIIDTVGAEKLLGRGDMLYASAADPAPIRIQGTFVNDNEVEDVVDAVKEYGEPDYIDEEMFVEDDDEDGARDLFGEPMDDDDPLYDQALKIVVEEGKASASYLQRRLKIGYNRAARLVEEMEERGIVGPANGSKPREVIHIP